MVVRRSRIRRSCSGRWRRTPAAWRLLSDVDDDVLARRQRMSGPVSRRLLGLVRLVGRGRTGMLMLGVRSAKAFGCSSAKRIGGHRGVAVLCFPSGVVRCRPQAGRPRDLLLHGREQAPAQSRRSAMPNRLQPRCQSWLPASSVRRTAAAAGSGPDPRHPARR